MSGSPNTSVEPPVQCQDCGSWCDGNYRGGRCTMPDSGYTNTLTLHEFSCKKGWRAKTAEPEKPVEEPEGTPMLFGYPVHTNHDWTPDMAAGITFGPPMIAAPKETPYLDALQKRYLEALKRMQVDQSQVKTLNVDSSSIDPGVTASLVILDEAAKMPDWVWERNEFKKPSEVDPNSFSSEELPSAVQHLLPPGEDGTLGGYLVPPAYQQAILRHFQDQQEMQGVSLLDPRRRQHKTIYGTAGRLMIRHVATIRSGSRSARMLASPMIWLQTKGTTLPIRFPPSNTCGLAWPSRSRPRSTPSCMRSFARYSTPT
jgi:hypothetical protein